ncbi:hypothetical protein [Pelagicoccus sp. SDUM812003]|uniref:hypothetical protein n=1 Tax=Pelagicoccus sp. SDUM812003 TaxID=3041267 RepID=UPI00280E8C81|nr:hypothetical protein [Pelagicoccus sp. SDUM812003]MDQ8205745.1 hypothetical protein [Pelagicoccus sp. SDUM812003]
MIENLKERYLRNVEALDIPDEFPDIKDELRVFTVFDPATINGVELTKEDKMILFQIGLPSEYKSAILFRSDLPSESNLRNQIGTTANGDPVCLKSDGSLTSYNHDREMEECFVSSNIVCYLKTVIALMEENKPNLKAIDRGLESHHINYWKSTGIA